MARLSKQEELEISDPDAARSDFIKALGDYPAPAPAPAPVFNRENPSGTDEFGFPLPEVPKITAATPGAVYVPTYTYDRGGARVESGGYYRLPTAQESGQIALAALPQDIKNKIAAEQLTPEYEQVRVRDGRGGEGYYENGKLTGFSSVSPDNIQTAYDLQGNPTGTRYFDRSGGIIGQITSPLVYGALLAMGGAGLSGLLGAGAGAGTLGAAEGALTASELASLPGAATGIGAGTAALTIPEVASLGSGATLGSLEGGLTAAEMASLPGAATGIETLGTAGATLGSLEGGLTASELAGLPSLGTTLGATEGALTAAEIANLPQLTSINQMVASGMAPGAAGAAGAASGVLTPAELAAASGVVTSGATPALVELANAGKGLPSTNEAVASGLGPGSAGAKAAVDGSLTAQELAAAAGTSGALNKDGIGDLLTKAKDAITGKAKDVLSGSGSGSGSGLGGVLGLMALMSMMNKGNAAPASTATIPELKATRSQLPYDVNKTGVNPNTPYRPGQGGVNYFSPTTYKAAGGGIKSIEQSDLGGYSDGGRLLQGPGDGVSDSIPAIIGRKQPARLANGEFVIPARIVSELGNGSTDAGAKRLYEMMARVQKARRNTKNVAANTKAAKYLPA